MNENPILYFYSVIVIFACAGSFATGMYVQKYASAGLRSVMVLSRTPCVWIFSVLLSWQKLIPLQIIGYAIVTIGTLIYNETIVLPCSIFKKDTQGEKERINEEAKQYGQA